MGTRTVCYFVDTNLFLQCRPLEQLDWTVLGDFAEVRLIVSRPVQREIDHLKNKGSDRPANRARAASAMFREMRLEGQKVVREAGPRVVLSVERQHAPAPSLEDQLDYQERDDQLVGTLHEFVRRREGTDARLLTHDTTPPVYGPGSRACRGRHPGQLAASTRVDRHRKATDVPSVGKRPTKEGRAVVLNSLR